MKTNFFLETIREIDFIKAYLSHENFYKRAKPQTKKDRLLSSLLSSLKHLLNSQTNQTRR